MPELTEVTDTKPREEENDSGTDSDGDDSIPELEDTAGDGGAGEASLSGDTVKSTSCTPTVDDRSNVGANRGED